VSIDAKIEATRAQDGSVSGSVKETFTHKSSGAKLVATICEQHFFFLARFHSLKTRHHHSSSL
jgi:hypothetical protein